MPMVMITGQKGILKAAQARFQMVDTIASMKPLTKMTTQIVSAPTVPTVVREAFRVATTERPGPVHLELPEDIASSSTSETDLIEPIPSRLPTANPGALDDAAEVISSAQRRRLSARCYRSGRCDRGDRP